MKNVFLSFTFLCSSFLIAQEGTNMKKVITPPEKVRFAFEREYPEKCQSGLKNMWEMMQMKFDLKRDIM